MTFERHNTWGEAVSYRYLVLGAGRQGTAAAYDLALFGGATRITLADLDLDRARAAAERVKLLTGRPIVDALALDVTDLTAAGQAMRGHDVALSAVPYYLNLDLTRTAIEAGVSFCDLGGNTEIVRLQHAMDSQASAAGVRIVPDCGMGPGMGNTLAVYAMSLLDQPEHVSIYDGGLPQEPMPPWNYLATFNIAGLINEYHGGMTVLRNGELVHLPCFSELEVIHVPTVGHLEAFVVAGGVSTAPWTFRGQVQTYELKILRYPGTFAQLKAFHDLGLFDPEPIQVGQTQISPRAVFGALYEPKVSANEMRDVCVIRAQVLGVKDGRRGEARVDLIDRYDETTGFTAMERTTGWHASIVASMLARGDTPIGAVPLESAVPGARFVEQARQRGFKITARVTFAQ